MHRLHLAALPFLVGASLAAAEVHFTAGEGYVAGPLHAQPAADPAWALVSDSHSFTVNPPHGVVVNSAQTATSYAVWQTPVDPSRTPTLTSHVDFHFIQSLSISHSPPITALTYLHNATNGVTRLRAFFGRSSGTDMYRLGFYQASGAPVTNLVIKIPGDALGINTAAGAHASQPLRLAFTLNRGATASDWTGSVTLTNLATNTLVGTVAIPAFTTSAAFFEDTALFPAISTETLQQAALLEFALTAFSPPDDTASLD